VNQIVHHRTAGPARLAQVVVVLVVAGVVGLFLVSLFLGPVAFILAALVALFGLATEPVFRHRSAEHAVAVAEEAGATEPITVWGKVAETWGRCPTGPTPVRGAEFALSRGDVWPHLCEHARRAVLELAARMERGESMPEAPLWYHDADHSFRIELHRERTAVHVEPL
jgi:hypothetical protein